MLKTIVRDARQLAAIELCETWRFDYVCLTAILLIHFIIWFEKRALSLCITYIWWYRYIDRYVSSSFLLPSMGKITLIAIYIYSSWKIATRRHATVDTRHIIRCIDWSYIHTLQLLDILCQNVYFLILWISMTRWTHPMPLLWTFACVTLFTHFSVTCVRN